jgi:parallel beta-helix repeat protein
MKNKKGIAFSIGLMFIMIIFTPSIYANFCKIQPQEATSQRNNRPHLAYSNHPPIYINGNNDFTPENGVICGNGTENDPYLIENWVIVGDGSTSSGIFINNTNVYFIIRNCSVSNFSETQDRGILFNHVENGGIDDTVVFANDDGINVCESTNITFTDCTCYENIGDEQSWWSSGIHCYNSSYITVTSCECFDNQNSGIYLDDVRYATIEYSVFHNNDLGIDLFGGLSVYNSIRNCIVSNNTYGIYGFDNDRHSSHHKILNCEIYDNGSPGGEPGISISSLDDNTIENCTLYRNRRGIYIDSSSNNMIRNCTIYNHHFNNDAEYNYGIVIGGLIIPRCHTHNNTITDCDIYDNEGGIWVDRSVNTKIHENNIFNNSLNGILVTWFSTARINWNNIYGNGYSEDWGSGFWIEKSLIDGRHNWLGADDGPKIYRLDYFANAYPIRPGGHGDKIYWFRSIPFILPWEQKPVPIAGRQTSISYE